VETFLLFKISLASVFYGKSMVRGSGCLEPPLLVKGIRDTRDSTILLHFYFFCYINFKFLLNA